MIASQPRPAGTGDSPAQGLPPAFTSFIAPITLRLRDITSFQLPRLAAGASGAGPASSPDGSSEAPSPTAAFASYETELNDSLEQCAGLLEEGQILVEDLCTDPALEGAQVAWIQSEWARVTDQFQRTRSSARTELLQARKSLAERKKQGLLKPSNSGLPAGALGPEQSVRQRQAQAKRSGGQSEKQPKATAFAGDDEALLASSSLTSSLHTSLSLLSDSLSQSTYSAQLLDESSASLSSLSLDYSSFSDLLKNSGSILKSMEKQDRIDALMLLGAYAFFLLCVGYILKVRIWDRGIGVLWFFLRMFGIVGRGSSSSSAAAAPAATTAAGAAVKHLTESIVVAANSSAGATASEALADTAGTSTSAGAGVLEAVSTALAGAASTAAAAAAAAAASGGIGIGSGEEPEANAQAVESEGDAAVPDTASFEPEAEPEPEPAVVSDTDNSGEVEPGSQSEADAPAAALEVEELHVEILDGDGDVRADAGLDAENEDEGTTVFYDAEEGLDGDDAGERAPVEVEESDVPEGEGEGHVHDEL